MTLLIVEGKNGIKKYILRNENIQEQYIRVKYSIKHITLSIATIMMVLGSAAQNKTRFVELGSTHALSINESIEYRFEWTIQSPSGAMIPVSSVRARTENIVWDERGTYHVTMVPILASEQCYGENVKLDVVAVDYLSLHTFDDVFYTTTGTPVNGDVSTNDFDDRNSRVFYSSTLVKQPSSGSVTMNIDGTFTYTPKAGFKGVDEFVYEAFVRGETASEMYSNAKVTIVVRDDNQKADLYVEKTGPEKALYGETIEYSIKVINNGPDDAQNVTIKDTLAFGLFDPEYRIDSNAVFEEWNNELLINSLAANDTLELFIRTDISENSTELIYNQAITWSDTYDPDETDNDSIWRTDVSAIYANLPMKALVASCETYTMPGDKADANFEIESYQWSPSSNLSAVDIPNPLFVPDRNTFGKTLKYILTVTDKNGNSAKDSIELVVAEAPTAVIEADTMYKDLNVDININASQSNGIEGLKYLWTTNNGYIESTPYDNHITISTIGTYYLEVEDSLGCTAYDSVIVLLNSYPPETMNDHVAIIAGDSVVLPGMGAEYLALADDPVQQREYLELLPDSNYNVLSNDYDLNEFDIQVTDVVTPPSSGLIDYTWNSNGQFIIKPDHAFWGTDSIQYRVCNNGEPVKCNTAWLYINSLRPPLNADAQIIKTGQNIKSNGNDIAFWGDTIRYKLQITNNGPDTLLAVAITDIINSGLLNPEYSFTGASWNNWPLIDRLDYTEGIKPFEDTLSLNIRAYVRSEANSIINNKAFVETGIIENDFTNDTSIVTTKIKERVVADAGNDVLLGSCIETLELDGAHSTGENLSYSWTPVNHAVNYLQNANTANPVFDNPGLEGDYHYKLTVSDDDYISASDTVTITILPPPLAKTVDDLYEIAEGDTIGLDGGASEPAQYINSYQWDVVEGNILAGTETNRITAVTDTGTYKLTITDIAGCQNSVEVPVYQYYYPPVAVPDYYSTQKEQSISGNLLENDDDPNSDIFGESFDLFAVTQSLTLENGASVVIQENGDFQFDPGNAEGVVSFTYEVYNEAELPKTDRGYVRITINNNVDIANIRIKKEAESRTVLIGDIHGAVFKITVTNDGPVTAENVLLTDSLSEHFRNDAIYYFDDEDISDAKVFNGTVELGDIAKNEERIVRILATIAGGAPRYVFNAAMSSSNIFDNQFNWDDEITRNVDTIRVITESNLLAVAGLVEENPNDALHSDNTIGRCDNFSYLTAENSKPNEVINGWSWSPRKFLTHPDSSETYFNFDNLPDKDTTVTFKLTVSIDGAEFDFAEVDVHFSPKVIADAGPDLKINEGEPLIIDATNSTGAGANYEWLTPGSTPDIDEYEDGNKLKPVIKAPGVYVLNVTDMHGCTDSDTVIVKVNTLYLVNDIVNVVEGDTIVGNVATNDFDPDGDNIYYTGTVIEGPEHGILLEYPMTSGIEKSALAENRIGADGSFVYIPDPGYSGYDYFIYEGCDDNIPNNLCKEAIVHINVVDIDESNTPPVVNPDHLFANHGDTIRTNILANDYDPDGGKVTVWDIVTDPAKGKILYSDGAGNIVYVPNENATGTDHFEYQVCDNGTTTGCNIASVTIEILKIAQENHRPVAGDDAYFTVGKAIKGNVLDNDYDPDGDSFSLIHEAVEGPHHGRFQINRNGSFRYTPDPGFEGTDQIVYQIEESKGKDESLIDKATVYIVSLSEQRYATDVSVRKTAVEEMLSGQTIEYDITVKVEGPTLANDVVVIDEMDSLFMNVEFSDDRGVTWSDWDGTYNIDQMMLYQVDTVSIRARIPDVYEGDLSNIACVEHEFTEINESNNCAEAVTGIYQRVIADAGSDTLIGFCQTDETFMLDASGSIGISDLEYTWISVSETAEIQNPDAEKTSIIAEPNSVNEFMLIVSSSVNGFTDTDTSYVTVSVDRAPQAWPGGDGGIWPDNDDPVLLDGSSSTGADGGLEYLWWIYDENGNYEVIGEKAAIEVTGSNDYYLTITDKYGCTDTEMVHVGFPVYNYIAVDDQAETYQQQEIDIRVLDNDILDDEDAFKLDFLIILEQPAHGDVVVSSQDSTITYIPEPYYFGPDTFTYQMSTENNYTDNATVYINVLEKLPVIPTGFSPNADGINDFFIIENIELYPENSITIFNRWGNIIYEKEPYTNDNPWDGVANKGIRIGNGVVPTGVYLYVLDLGDDERLSQDVYKGNIYIASDNRR